MDIECKLQREGGTHVPIERTTYHFAPRADGAHVAAVENEAHQDLFLAIPEAYRLYRGAAAASVETKAYSDATAATGTAPLPDLSPAQQATMQILLGSSEHEANYTIGGTNYALGDVVALAHTASGLSVDEWNDLTDNSRADLIDEQLDKIKGAGQDGGTGAPPDERAELAAQYKAKFSRPAHHSWDAAAIRAKLADA
jgi:hypothetical protein